MVNVKHKLLAAAAALSPVLGRPASHSTDLTTTTGTKSTPGSTTTKYREFNTIATTAIDKHYDGYQNITFANGKTGRAFEFVPKQTEIPEVSFMV